MKKEYKYIIRGDDIMAKNSENQRLYIEFGEEHYNPLGLIRSLGEGGIRPIAIIKKGQSRLASKSKYISKLHLVDSIEEGYNILLNEYGNEKNKPVVFTTDDTITSYLDNKYDVLKDKFIFFNAGENGRITKYMNKDTINKLAEKYKIKTPKTWVVRTGEIPDNLVYPVITKAIISTKSHWKDESFICNNEIELNRAFESIKSEKIMIEQFIKKKNELCLDGYSIEHGQKVFYAIASNYINIIDNAYSNYMVVKNTYDKEIEQKLNKMFKDIGFEGIFSVEFLITENDELYFLEINFRNSTWSYASTKAGMNLPILWSSAMTDSSIYDKSYRKFDNFTAMAEFVDYSDRVKTHQISKIKWFKQMLNCKCLYFINKKDMRPIYSKFTNKLKKVVGIKNENR